MALAVLVVLFASCGDDGSPSDSATATGATDAGTTETAAPEAPQNGDGGTSTPDGPGKKKQAGDRSKSPASPGGSRSDAASKPSAGTQPSGKAPAKKVKKFKQKTPQQVERDLYKAGKQACYVFGLDAIVKEYELPTHNREEVARFYAELFEKANPGLVAPYYQGCLQGLKDRARRDRRVSKR